ncbi:MAG: 4-hydroxybenzoate 3-monooxygenase [Chloroflexota bacterium]
MHTQVAIVGAGPAGLMLSHLLARAGIQSVVLEHRSRDYVERRVRAGVLEHQSVELLCQTGVGDRLRAESLVHHGIELRFDGESHRIDLSALTGGKSITVYGQQEVVKDLITARLADGGDVRFEAAVTTVEGLQDERPTLRYHYDGAERVLTADFVAACDGSHSVCRDAIPRSAIRMYQRTYPFAWLGILAAVAPSSEELIYAYHPRGFALQSMRTPNITRAYLQCAPDENLDEWSDERIWDELSTRFELPGFTLGSGPILERAVTAMRSFVAEPMQHGRLFLLGDAAHVVPPTGAKGMNLALGDARALASAMARHYRDGKDDWLDAYSQTCLPRVWRAEHFSWWMTSMLHRADEDHFTEKLQLSQLHYVTSSAAAMTSLAENYVGLSYPDRPSR